MSLLGITRRGHARGYKLFINSYPHKKPVVSGLLLIRCPFIKLHGDIKKKKYVSLYGYSRIPLIF